MDPLKILIVGVTEIAWSTTHGIKNAFEALGHEVYLFNYREIAQAYDKKNIIIRLVDKGLSFLRKCWLPMRIRRLYYFMPNRRKMNLALKSMTQQTHFDLILLFKTDTVDWEILATLSKRSPTWYFFMDPPSQAFRMQAIEYVKRSTWASATFSQVQNLFLKANKNSSLLLEGEDSDLFYPPQSQKTPEIDCIFIGSSDQKRKKVIHDLIAAKISIKWHGEGALLPPIYMEDLVSTYHDSKIVLNINRDGEGFSNRIIQALLCDSFVLTEYCPDIEKFFHQGIHLDWYHTTEECIQKIHYYLNHQKKREEIAKTGGAYAKQHFLWQHTAEKILSTCTIKSINV